MDPLSIIASSIGVGHALSRTIGIIRRTLKAGPELDALQNEISDLSIVLRELLDLLCERATLGNPLLPSSNLIRYACASKTKLESIAISVEAWKDFASAGGAYFTEQPRLRILRIGQKAKKFRQELTLLKYNLTSTFAVLSASTSSRMEVDLKQLLLVSQRTAATQTELKANLGRFIRQHEDSEAALPRDKDPSCCPEDESQQVLAASNSAYATPNNDELDVGFVRALHTNGPVLFDSSTMTAIAAVGIRTAQLPRAPCTAWCSCACHAQSRFRTPRLLDQVTGSFFIGYSGIPFLTKPCNQALCRLRAQPSSSVTYTFPPWLLARAVSFVVNHTPLAGPVASLKVHRTVSGTAEIFTYAKTGEVAKMRALFENGLASPHDVHYESGVTALHLAISHQQISVCKLLLQANADPFLEDESRWTAADNAWDKILSKSFTAPTERALRLMFSETECIERREFTVLHKIVLGLAPNDLQQELNASTADLNALDSNDRTPLSLAAERADISSVSILLQLGADATISSTCQTSPLHFAVCASDPSCIDLLINHGADVNALTGWDQTPLSYVAAYRDDPGRCITLLNAGADPEIRDLDGMTAIDWTAISGNAAVAECLVSYGANLYNEDNQGNTALVHAIAGNRRSVLRKIAPPSWTPGSVYETCLALQARVLRTVIKDADLKTMALLHTLPIRFTEAAVDQLGGRAVLMEQLNMRSDACSEMVSVFSGLIRETQPSMSRQESLTDGEGDVAENWVDAVEY